LHAEQVGRSRQRCAELGCSGMARRCWRLCLPGWWRTTGTGFLCPRSSTCGFFMWRTQSFCRCRVQERDEPCPVRGRQALEVPAGLPWTGHCRQKA